MIICHEPPFSKRYAAIQNRFLPVLMQPYNTVYMVMQWHYILSVQSRDTMRGSERLTVDIAEWIYYNFDLQVTHVQFNRSKAACSEMYFDLTRGTPKIYRRELLTKLYTVGMDVEDNVLFGTDDNTAGGNLVFDDTILTEVTLDCGEGIELGAEATEFYIALPPQTFENGFTVEIECYDSSSMTKATDNMVVIERNHILPMVEFDYEGYIPPVYEGI
jgi:hypothetical protein